MSWKGVKKQTNIENIKAWCDEMGIEDYTINNKGEIDVDGKVNLMNKQFKEIPYKFGKVTKYFDLSGNKNLTSLKNCPNYVGGFFNCNSCINLDLLEGCPKEVNGDFYCSNFLQKFTKEEVRSLCDVKRNIYV